MVTLYKIDEESAQATGIITKENSTLVSRFKYRDYYLEFSNRNINDDEQDKII